MKNFPLFSLILLFLSTSGLGFCGGSFELSGEWLYMHSSMDQPNYMVAQVSPTGLPAVPPFGQRLSTDQDLHSGYRVEGVYNWACQPNRFRVRWTEFGRYTETDDYQGPGFSTLGYPTAGLESPNGIAQISDVFHFRYLEILLERDLFVRSSLVIGLAAGVQANYLEMNERVYYQNIGSPNPLRDLYRSRNIGVGPELGLDFRLPFCFCDAFSLLGKAYSSFLVTEKKDSTFFQVFANGFTIGAVDESYIIVTPTAEFKLGLKYTRTIQRTRTGQSRARCEIEAGYSAIYVHKGLNRPIYYDSAGRGNSTNEYIDYMLYGPYLRVGSSF